MPTFVDVLRHEIETRLSALGLASTVKVERIGKTKLYRTIDFEQLRHAERQNLVWTIAREVLTPERQRQITMIYTVTMDEMGDEESCPPSRK